MGFCTASCGSNLLCFSVGLQVTEPAIDYPWFHKTTLLYLFKEKRVKFIFFFWHSPLFGFYQKAKYQYNCNALNLNHGSLDDIIFATPFTYCRKTSSYAFIVTLHLQACLNFFVNITDFCMNYTFK